MKKEIPILFSTQMVQALLADTKTETRRTIKPQPDENGVTFMKNAPLDWEAHYKEEWKPWKWDTEQGETIAKHCPYGQPGDWLWVRESFVSGFKMDDGCFAYDDEGNHIEKIWYKADGDLHNWWTGDSDFPSENIPWKPSIHMPKAAARLWLEVLEIKVERLQDISEADAMAEGIEWQIKYPEDYPTLRYYRDYMFKNRFAAGMLFGPKQSFKSLWQSINGPESWNANPWLWVVKFKIISKTGKPC